MPQFGSGTRVSTANWSKMRLGFAAFWWHRSGVFQNASQFDGFGQISRISARLRRILEHPPAVPTDRCETQTHFGTLGTAEPHIPEGSDHLGRDALRYIGGIGATRPILRESSQLGDAWFQYNLGWPNKGE